MTNLYLMRHTEPKRGHPADGERPLVNSGVAEAGRMAQWLKGHIGRVDIVITSPFVRALQTAKIMGAALGAHLADTTALQPDGEPKAMWDEITRLAQASKDVLVVGHDPSLNAFICWLMGYPVGDQEDLRLDWGAIAYVKVSPDPATAENCGQLKWLVTPELVASEEQSELEEATRQFAESLTETAL